jgi:hypothetical protein
MIEMLWWWLTLQFELYGDLISQPVVAHMYRPLIKWIEEHRPPGLQRPGTPLRGATVWKVKNMASGASGVNAQASQATPLLPTPITRPSTPSTPISSSTPPERAQTPVTIVPEEPPGKAFRNFRFDFALILEQL